MHYLTVAQLLWLQWVEQHAKDDDVLPAGGPADDGLRPVAGRRGGGPVQGDQSVHGVCKDWLVTDPAVGDPGHAPISSELFSGEDLPGESERDLRARTELLLLPGRSGLLPH